ncbi:MAG: LON peptidase substrate-binding domain-containing protein [Pseudomonadales bacterium]
MSNREIPLFPLRTVLFPDGRLPLRIFETRYMDMVRRCTRESEPFGVVLIRHGQEARAVKDAEQPDVFGVGTTARIVDFNQLSDGMLGIVCRGERKFRVLRTQEQADHLLIGTVELLPEEPAVGVSEARRGLVDILEELMQHPMIQKLGLDLRRDDGRSVGWRLAELLPIEPEIKQSLLQMQSPTERLTELQRLVDKLRGNRAPRDLA